MAESGTCWVLVNRDTDEPLDDDGTPHFESEARAAEMVATCAANYRPRRLDKPCVTLICGCCGYVYDQDENEDVPVHFRDLDEARTLVAADGWTVAGDGAARCVGCATGNCGERRGEVSRG